MWQRLTQRARKAIFLAQEEAARLGSQQISTEHLLLGLTKERDSVAVRILTRMRVNLAEVCDEIEKRLARGNGSLTNERQFAPSAKRAIELACEEARGLGCNFVGTEHLLLGLLREEEGLAGRALCDMGVDIDKTRSEVARMEEHAGVSERSSAPEGAESSVANVNEGETGARQIRLCELAKSTELRGRDLLSIDNLSVKDIRLIFDIARLLKSSLTRDLQMDLLAGKTLAMIFEKPSLRTRVTFEAGMTQLGGHAIYLAPQDARIGQRETIADAASNLARWVDGIMARTFSHQTVLELAEHASIPVINGLSDLEHPCQALADFFTIQEKKDVVKGLKLAYIGDGNNVCNSLMLLAAKLGTHFVAACPAGYEPDTCLTERACTIAKESGAAIDIVRDPAEAAQNADVLYTDVWASMGQEDEAVERKKVFGGKYQVNREILDEAKGDVIVLHCLPAHRGEEITDEVIDGPHSAVLDQAENRLHVQKALLVLML